MKEVLIIGGGAAGFFCAINLAQLNRDYSITILEKTSSVLSKVKISGGGRCNVTHACFVPRDLVENYPRGKKELLGPFHQFQPGDTIGWFDEKGVELKIEKDGRMFPASDSSQTIVDCFCNTAEGLGVKVALNEGVKNMVKTEDGWSLTTTKDDYKADAIVMCAGSSKLVWNMLSELNHSIISPVPSLFTFNISDNGLNALAGLSLNLVEVSIPSLKHVSAGPLMVTHWGISGPAVLKSSSFLARELFDLNYEFKISIDLLPSVSKTDCENVLLAAQTGSKKKVVNYCPFEIPNRFWVYLCQKAGVPEERVWPELRKVEKNMLVLGLKYLEYNVNGKSTFKEEFVTAGGIDLKEVNFKTMESRVLSDLYFAGEVLNIDAVTGGFNFQAAWTTGFIAAQTIAKK